MVISNNSAHARKLSCMVTASVLAIAGVAQPACAQTAPAADPPAVDDIVVTAQRREQRLSDVPISVQAITGEVMARRGIEDTRALGQISPSLSFAEAFTATASSVILRGVSSAAVAGGIQPSTAVVIDGVPTARQSEFITDLADIDRIEVLSGPQGTLFGKNSTAGVINIVTKKPAKHFEASAESGITTDDEYLFKGMVNVPFANNAAALRINAFYRDQNPIVKNVSGPDAYGRKSRGVQGRLSYDVSDTFNALVTVGYTRSESTYTQQLLIDPITGALGDLQRSLFGASHIGRGRDTINQDAPGLNDIRTTSAVGELTWKPSDTFSVVSLTGYRNVHTYADNDIDSGPAGFVSGSGFHGLGSYPIYPIYSGYDHFPVSWHYISQELRATYSNSRLTVIGGLFYQDFRENYNDNVPIIFDSSYFNGTYGSVTAGFEGVPSGILFYQATNMFARTHDRTAAIFGDVTYKVTDTVSLFGGLRQTHENYRLDYSRRSYFSAIGQIVDGAFVSYGNFDPITGALSADPTPNTEASPYSNIDILSKKVVNNTSGRIGAQWQPDRDLNFYASINRGYKGPAGDQGSQVNNVSAPALLDPEIATSYEIGAKVSLFDRRLAMQVALYNQTIKHIQQSSTLPNSVLTQLINAGDLRSRGVEFNFQGVVSSRLRFDGGLAYTDAEYRGGFFSCNQAQTPGVAPCTLDNNGDGVAETQSLTGQPAIASPKWKVLFGGTYTMPIDAGWNVALNVNYDWRSAIQYQLGNDPATREPHHGFLDASLSFFSDGGWTAKIYGRNLTNEFYYNAIDHADYFIGKSYGRLARDYKRYGGLSVSKTF